MKLGVTRVAGWMAEMNRFSDMERLLRLAASLASEQPIGRCQHHNSQPCFRSPADTIISTERRKS